MVRAEKEILRLRALETRILYNSAFRTGRVFHGGVDLPRIVNHLFRYFNAQMLYWEFFSTGKRIRVVINARNI